MEKYLNSTKTHETKEKTKSKTQQKTHGPLIIEYLQFLVSPVRPTQIKIDFLGFSKKETFKSRRKKFGVKGKKRKNNKKINLKEIHKKYLQKLKMNLNVHEK